MNRLDAIEADSRKAIGEAARGSHTSHPVRAFFITFFALPFLIVEAMFVPLIGQILVGGVFLTTATYLWKTKSVKEGIAIALAVVVALVTFTTLRSPDLIQNQPFVVYSFFGFCTFVTIGILILVSAALWSYYETGRSSIRNRSATDSE